VGGVIGLATRRLVGIVALLGGAALVAIPAGGAAAAPAPVGLSITLSDSLAQVHSGQDVTMTARLSNAGTRPFSGHLVIEVPGYVHVTHAQGGKIVRSDVRWSVSVPGGKSVSREVKAHIGMIAAGQLRVTTLASVFAGKVSGVPLIRTADADLIAGVKDPARTVPPGGAAAKGKSVSPAARDGGTNWWLAAGAPAAVVVVLAAAVLWWRRRRRGGTPVDVVDSEVSRERALVGE